MLLDVERWAELRASISCGALVHPRERYPWPPQAASIALMPCILKLIMDLILGPEEQIAYVSVTTR